jgi:hypothetical protein
LKVNFKKHGNGAEKIENGDFVIQDAITKRDIDLSTDWEVCFSPGQRVMMSIILTRALVLDITCPKCHNPNFGSSAFDQEVDIDWYAELFDDTYLANLDLVRHVV